MPVAITEWTCTLHIEPLQEDLSRAPIPPPDERLPSMIKAHIDPSPHVIKLFMLRQFKVKHKDLLKSLHPQRVLGIDGDFPASLLAEGPARQLVGGRRHFPLDDNRNGFPNLFRKAPSRPSR